MTPRRPLSHFCEDVIGTLLFHRSPRDASLVAQLRAEIAKPSLPPAMAEDFWSEKRIQLGRLIAERDPFGFLRWDPIRTTMVKRGKASVAHELRHLQRRHDWRPRWRPALRESTIGRPRPFYRCPGSSGNLIHHAYHLCRFEEITGISLTSWPFVVEFGGGYGSMCRLFHQLGFVGTFLIFDLPEIVALQRFFLRHVGVSVTNAETGVPGPPRGAVTTSTLDDLRAVIRSGRVGPRAFIATWSLSEAPVELRRSVLAEVGTFDAFLFGISERFGTIDNARFFDEWRSGLPGFTWHQVPIPHLNKAWWYLFGVKS